MLSLTEASEDAILPYALGVAQRFGDPAPDLIQHVSSTRRAATSLLGSVVFADEPVWLIAIRGRFHIRPSRLSRPGMEALGASLDQYILMPVLAHVVIQDTGVVVDTGSRSTYPELSQLGLVVTDLAVS